MKSTLTSENKKTNKTVIRKETIKGEFTTVQHSILLDTRITANAFRLFTAILSDSDTKFELSQSLYCNRLNIPYTTFKDSINNLIECGYISRTDINKDKPSNKVIYHYTLSEHGDLGSAETKSKVKPNNTATSTEIIQEDFSHGESIIEIATIPTESEFTQQSLEREQIETTSPAQTEIKPVLVEIDSEPFTVEDDSIQDVCITIDEKKMSVDELLKYLDNYHFKDTYHLKNITRSIKEGNRSTIKAIEEGLAVMKVPRIMSN
jgi:predicted transcriptional regulator